MVTLGDCAKRYLPLLLGRESREGIGNTNCGAVLGTTILKTAVLPTATTIAQTASTTTTVFELSVALRALFCVRTN